MIAGSALTEATVSYLSPRPTLAPHPYSPRLPIPNPPKRDKVCYVKSHNDGVSDDSCQILTALHRCNNGGHVVFQQDTTYIIGKALDLTFLKHIDIDVQGTILFTNDTDYWQAHGFQFGFQNVTTFFKLGGEDVLMYGGGTIDGNGQAWYDLYAKNIFILRPVLFGIDGLKDAIFSGLNLQYSPQYYHFVANSSNVVWDHISISGQSHSSNQALNTDGWDFYRSSDITVMNSVIDNGDDCISFKPNSTQMLIQGLDCSHSHGISVGSLGQYPGVYDIVEDVMVSNITLKAAGTGARIKVWPNIFSSTHADLVGGGGSGRVRNCTWEDLNVDSVDYAIEINGCYKQNNLTLCREFPSLLTIDDIVFRNFKGSTNAHFSPDIAAIACSGETACTNIRAEDILVTSPAGTKEAYCLNVDEAVLGLNCTGPFNGLE
ncbi:exopolygalacturonase [Coniochaeta sp. PMI_546]|nr:exopolygalacturonase [Coniochaeta sp. PMI_546]